MVLDAPKLEVQVVCEATWGFWEPNLGPPKEQEELLTAERCLQPGLANFLITKHFLMLLWHFIMRSGTNSPNTTNKRSIR